MKSEQTTQCPTCEACEAMKRGGATAKRIKDDHDAYTHQPAKQDDYANDNNRAKRQQADASNPTAKQSEPEVEFHRSNVDEKHLFIGGYHDPKLCPECIKPGSLTPSNTDKEGELTQAEIMAMPFEEFVEWKKNRLRQINAKPHLTPKSSDSKDSIEPLGDIGFYQVGEGNMDVPTIESAGEMRDKINEIIAHVTPPSDSKDFYTTPERARKLIGEIPPPTDTGAETPDLFERTARWIEGNVDPRLGFTNWTNGHYSLIAFVETEIKAAQTEAQGVAEELPSREEYNAEVDASVARANAGEFEEVVRGLFRNTELFNDAGEDCTADTINQILAAHLADKEKAVRAAQKQILHGAKRFSKMAGEMQGDVVVIPSENVTSLPADVIQFQDTPHQLEEDAS